MKNILKNKILIGILIIVLLVPIIVFMISGKKNNVDDNFPGTLIINSDKSEYAVGERIYIQITALDSKGKVKCDDNLSLTGSNDNIPNSTFDIPVNLSPTCSSDGSTNNPDYTAFFTPVSEGSYKLFLKDLNRGNTAESEIFVGNTKSATSITRWGPTRITAGTNNRYPMKLIVSSQRDISGTVTENIPQDVEIIWQGPAKLNGQTLSWDIDLKAGETNELTYEYKVSNSSNSVINLGKVKITESGKNIFEENQSWQIVINQ